MKITCKHCGREIEKVKDALFPWAHPVPARVGFAKITFCRNVPGTGFSKSRQSAEPSESYYVEQILKKYK
jgi:hypothetical protein